MMHAATLIADITGGRNQWLGRLSRITNVRLPGTSDRIS
jgi:hypothetical protein